MAPELSAVVLIGRFQPFHNGHAKLLAHALTAAPRVIVVLGSSLQATNAKNPFTWQDRAALIGSTLTEGERARLTFVPMRDFYDDARWAKEVTRAVEGLVTARAPIGVLGHLKDASSQYLNRFPNWTLIEMPQQGEIDATSLRQIYFEVEDPPAAQALLAGLVPAPVAAYLTGWKHLPRYSQLREEHLALEESKQVWGKGPFITVDALVKAGDRVLLIRRGKAPGKGLWAIPGGFLEARERVLQGAIRELREETGLSVLQSTLEASLKGVAVFDHPDRSLRGRTITHAHYFDLPGADACAVNGADDAAEAQWTPIAALEGMADQLFEDHFVILSHFLGIDARVS